ncbi:hypothetical protein BCU70_17785 [Vibrio sp. 10N.286.49.C2]|uniref:restriction endonuclease subunit S n=1 Tax=Vibrio TaxID=662 RepID=UPI00080E31CB|nr:MULTISPECIES: restriction endonuclease subunit S [Vibrio]OCH60335.1 hypothetical protein A6D94_19260 [Vibrio splendidus]PMH36280.1 hypothetical protein BCU70_17785 [Vibrio sp. 10N.286.49.C2]PMH53396.1 hypothetical protein BCU66_00805 [Vibrio sp. 10N.286.49.B1]
MSNLVESLKQTALGKIPTEWSLKKFEDCTDKVGSGVTPKGGSKAYVESGIPLLRSQNILSGKLKLADVAFITQAQHDKMKGSKLKAGDVLLNITGASIGRCAVLPDNFDEGNVNQHVCIIRTNELLVPSYCGFFLNSAMGQKQIWNLQAGGNREGLNFQQIKSFSIIVPPREEQQKIAEVLSTVDQKIDLIDQKIAETQKLKTGLMQKLFSEGVGVQDEEGNWQPHTEFQVASDVNVPACWNLMSLENIATVERGKFSARPRNDPKYYGGDIPFVQTGDVVNAATYIETYSQTLNDLGLTVSKMFPVGTILITIAANIGDVAITKYPLACPDSLVGIQANESKCNVHWLFYFLQTQKSELDSKATKSAQKNINLQVLKPLTVYLPPLEEQSIIAETLSTVDEKLALLEKQKVETQQLKKGLMQKLLTGEWRVPLDS